MSQRTTTACERIFAETSAGIADQHPSCARIGVAQFPPCPVREVVAREHRADGGCGGDRATPSARHG
jgi:hypothetical protein